METNPYAPPLAPVADDLVAEKAPPLWNPNAAACWSLVFTVAFGAWLHMRNWEALGETAKAARSRLWLRVSLGVLLVWVVTDVLLGPAMPPAIDRVIGLALLLSWYFGSAREQARHVARHFGTAYPRQGWGRPIATAIGWIIGYMVIAIAIGIATDWLHDR